MKKIEGIHFRPSPFTPAAASGVTSPQERQVKTKRSSTSALKLGGSLNYHTRQKENERIYRENMIMFSKLKESKANLRKTEMDEHYHAHRKYLNSMSKAKEIELNFNYMTQTGAI